MKRRELSLVTATGSSKDGLKAQACGQSYQQRAEQQRRTQANIAEKFSGWYRLSGTLVLESNSDRSSRGGVRAQTFGFQPLKIFITVLIISLNF
ncbi:MAG: hypothetical protein V1874_07850 [Spirochaetota bacterium]